MSVINNGVLVHTSGMDPLVEDRIWRAMNLEASGVDLDAIHPASPAFRELAEVVPDFFHMILLGEVTSDEWADMADQLEQAAGICTQSGATTGQRDGHGAERCTKGSRSLRLTCLQSLAEGWITASDLCPRCTRRFMAALESAAGEDEPLTWHDNYVQRSTGAAT